MLSLLWRASSESFSVCSTWRTPWAEGLSSASVLCEMKEQQAAHTAACVIPETVQVGIDVKTDTFSWTEQLWDPDLHMIRIRTCLHEIDWKGFRLPYKHFQAI